MHFFGWPAGANLSSTGGLKLRVWRCIMSKFQMFRVKMALLDTIFREKVFQKSATISVQIFFRWFQWTYPQNFSKLETEVSSCCSHRVQDLRPQHTPKCALHRRMKLYTLRCSPGCSTKLPHFICKKKVSNVPRKKSHFFQRTGNGGFSGDRWSENGTLKMSYGAPIFGNTPQDLGGPRHLWVPNWAIMHF